MSFDKENEGSRAETMELSDDALEGVSGGVALVLDPSLHSSEYPNSSECLTIAVEKPPASLLDDTPLLSYGLREVATGSLDGGLMDRGPLEIKNPDASNALKF